MASRFADIVSVKQFIEDQENENTKKKTQQNVALLKEFLKLKNESRLIDEIPPKKLNAYIGEFIITVRKKDNNEDYEPSSLRSSTSFGPFPGTRYQSHSYFQCRCFSANNNNNNNNNNKIIHL